jgi:hypothetical protein
VCAPVRDGEHLHGLVVTVGCACWYVRLDQRNLRIEEIVEGHHGCGIIHLVADLDVFHAKGLVHAANFGLDHRREIVLGGQQQVMLLHQRVEFLCRSSIPEFVLGAAQMRVDGALNMGHVA